MRPAPLPQALLRHLALAYWALIVYASLYPFRGWRFAGPPADAFLTAQWPHYWTTFDLVVNVLVYAPLGLLAVLALSHHLARRWALLLGIGLAGGTSLAIEFAQNWLPARVPSNLDLACNVLGGILGAVAAPFAGERWVVQVADFERRLLRSSPQAGFGLTLAGLWLIAQISPESAFATTGDLRQLFWDLDIGFEGLRYDPNRLLVFEAIAVATHLLAVGLLLRGLLRDQSGLLPAILLFFCVAATVRALSAAVLLSPPEAFAWLTPGTARGLFVGAVLLLPLLLVPRPWVAPLGCLALLVGTVTVNIMPEDPYRLYGLSAWTQGHFLNFNGLTRWLGFVWPFAALPYLVLTARRG